VVSRNSRFREDILNVSHGLLNLPCWRQMLIGKKIRHHR
jgi:hypothetical protein